MARITNVKSMLSLVRMSEDKEKKLIIRVHDPLLEENCGTFLWTVSCEKNEVVDIMQELQDTKVDITRKIKEITQKTEEIPQIEVDITSLLNILFGRGKLPEAFVGIRSLTEICINEIV